MRQILTTADLDTRPRCRTEAAFRAQCAREWARRGVTEQPQAAPLVAHINVGRWVTPCQCGSGVGAHPGWAYAACWTCGRSWTSIVFPSRADLAAFDAVLARRPMAGRWYSWTPEQTVADLIAENVAHCWPVPSDLEGVR